MVAIFVPFMMPSTALVASSKADNFKTTVEKVLVLVMDIIHAINSHM